MAMNPALAPNYFADGFQFEVAPRRNGSGSFALVAFGQVFLCGSETVGDEGAHSHSGLRKARGGTLARIRLFYIFSQREFDALRRGGKNQLIGGCSIAQFDHAILSPDWIGRAMKQVDCRYTGGELQAKIIGLGIDDIASASHCGGRK